MVTRLKGAQLVLTIGGSDYAAELTNYLVTSKDASAGVTTFADAAAGGAKEYHLQGSAVQSTDSNSLWSYIWANVGSSVAFVLKPHANGTASADQPHISGTVKIGAKPNLGGDAGTDEEFTFDFDWTLTGEPTLSRGVAAVPTISTADPASGVAAGELVTLAGKNFTGTTGVTMDGDAAEFIVVSDVQLIIVAPAAVDGSAPIIVTNATGASDSFAYTAASA